MGLMLYECSVEQNIANRLADGTYLIAERGVVNTSHVWFIPNPSKWLNAVPGRIMLDVIFETEEGGSAIRSLGEAPNAFDVPTSILEAQTGSLEESASNYSQWLIRVLFIRDLMDGMYRLVDDCDQPVNRFRNMVDAVTGEGK